MRTPETIGNLALKSARFERKDPNNSASARRTRDIELFDKVRAGDEEARKKIILNYDALVTSRVMKLADRITQSTLTLDDLIQEGRLGLMTAIEKFDYSLGFLFTTYATWWIDQKIGRAICEQGRVVRIPVPAHQSLNRISRFQRRYQQENEREATSQEIAAALGMNAELVSDMIRGNQPITSLELPLGRNSELVLGDLIPDKSKPPVQVQVENNLCRETIFAALKFLSPIKAHIIILRYGLLDGKQWTRPEISILYPKRPGQIRRLEMQALEELRQLPKVREMLIDYY